MFTGKGQAGNWADPNNWSGSGATPTSFDVIPVSTVENGAFTARILMFLGQEQVTVNGGLTTTSPGGCISFMVCEGANATFTPTSSLNDAGGMIVGNDGVGSLLAQGTAGGQHSTLKAANVQIGKAEEATGSVTVDGASLSSAQLFVVGQGGKGTLDVLHGGTVSAGGDLVVGAESGATGAISLASGGSLSVAGAARIGTAMGNAMPQGVGTVSIGAGSYMDVAQGLMVGGASAIMLAGGTLTETGSAGAEVLQGGRIVGTGTITAPTMRLLAGGGVEAKGGTLVVNAVGGDGTGTLQIDSGSTAVLSAATIGAVKIAFAGSGAALDLSHGVASAAAITDFAAGDTIVMQGIDQLSWNGTSDLLTLSDNGHAVDTLHILGSWGSSNPFSLTETSVGAVIGLAVPHS